MDIKKPRTTTRRQAQPRPNPLPTQPPVHREAPLETSALSRRRFVFTKKPVAAGSLIAIVAAAGLMSAYLNQGSNANTHAAAGHPEYATILPQGKSVETLGGWKRISPPGKDPVFAFADTINGVSISVSEQPLPASFKDNTPEHMAKLAEKFSATTKLEVGDTTVYVGTSVKGPQSALLAKNNLLIMIKSQKKISDAAWKQYAASLN